MKLQACTPSFWLGPSLVQLRQSWVHQETGFTTDMKSSTWSGEVKGTLIVSLFMISRGQVSLINRSKRKFRLCNWLEAFCHLASLWTLLWLNKCQVMPWQIKLRTRSWSSLNVKKHNDELFIRRGLHNRRLGGVNTKQELQHSVHFEQFRVFYAVKMVNKKFIKPLDQEGDLPDCEVND